MKDIYKLYLAIDNGINSALLDFDDDDNQLKKSRPLYHNNKEFHFGDYVYKDDILGYNNYIGEQVAICIYEEPEKELFMVVNHPLLNNTYKWANIDTRLYNDNLPENIDGWKNTLHILKNYSDELEGTIWDALRENEYIPSYSELRIIYNCRNNKVFDKIGLTQNYYWTSSLYHDPPFNGDAFRASFLLNTDLAAPVPKDLALGFFALLHI